MTQIIYGKSEVDNLLDTKQDAFKTYTNFGELRQDIINAYNNNKAVIICCKNFGTFNYYYNADTKVELYTTAVESTTDLRLYFTSLLPENDSSTSITVSHTMYRFTTTGVRQNNTGSQGLDISRFKCIIG